jgi:hypothetical protein
MGLKFNLTTMHNGIQLVESNWIQTVSGKGWFCLLLLYSPTEAWYEGKWLPGEIELVK